MAFRPGDSKREEFRKYLEKTGLLDALTKALVNLYEEGERPTETIQYVKERISCHPDPPPENQELESLKKEIAALRLENEQLKETISKQSQPDPSSSPENDR